MPLMITVHLIYGLLNELILGLSLILNAAAVLGD